MTSQSSRWTLSHGCVRAWFAPRGCRPLLLALAAAATVGPAATAYAYSIVVHPASAYSPNVAMMDSTLGIAGLIIEDFDDVNLVSGLQIQYTNPDAGPISTLPRVFVAVGYMVGNLWAGPSGLVNTVANNDWGVVGIPNIADRISFQVPGVQKFGVGLGNFQGDIRDHALFVNGVLVHAALETLPGFSSGATVRNGYLVVTAGPGEVINSVAIEPRLNGTATPEYDGLIFDHLAFANPVAPLASFTLSKSTIAGCKTVKGKVTLPAAAPPGGTTVTISETLAAATAPATLTVPAGATTATVTLRTSAVASDESGEVSATLGATTLTRSLTVRRISVASIAATPNPVVGGNSVAATAKLDCKAAPGDILVELSSSNPAVAGPDVPSLLIPAGVQSMPFTVLTSPVAVVTKPKIIGKANDLQKSKTLTVSP